MFFLHLLLKLFTQLGITQHWWIQGESSWGPDLPLHPNKTVSFYYLSDTNILVTTGVYVTAQH